MLKRVGRVAKLSLAMVGLIAITVAVVSQTSAQKQTSKTTKKSSVKKPAVKKRAVKRKPGKQPARGPARGQAVRFVVPKPEAMLLLMRTILIALDQANKTGNYTVLRDLSAPSFQARNSAARLSEIFSQLRKSGADLSAISITTPELIKSPVVNQNNQLQFVGAFPIAPSHVAFQLTFVPVRGHWRMVSISVGLRKPK